VSSLESRKKIEGTGLWFPATNSPGQLANLHAHSEEGAIANSDALYNHIPDQGTCTADAIRSLESNVGAYVAQKHHFTRKYSPPPVLRG
jgi:hypothetical protein